MAAAAKVLVVRTNICQLNEAWLRPFLAAGGAGADATPVKGLATGKCVGLEFAGAVRPARPCPPHHSMRFEPSFLELLSHDVVSTISWVGCPPVVQCMSHPCFLIYMASYDVASIIRPSLARPLGPGLTARR
jgi:hypothetical protein